MVWRGNAAHLARSLAGMGVDIDRVSSSLECDLLSYATSPGYVPLKGYCALLEEAAKQHCYCHHKLHFALEDYGLIGVMMATAPSLGEALHSVCDYSQLYVTCTDLFLHSLGDRTYFVYRVNERGLGTNRLWNELFMGDIVHLIRQAVGPDWPPLELNFSHSMPSETVEPDSFFGAPIYFGQVTNLLVFETEILAAEMPGSHADRFDSAIAELERMALASGCSSKLINKVMQVIVDAQYLSKKRHSIASISDVAEAVGLNEKTLQRQLATNGSSYRALVELCRYISAVHYLEATTGSIANISERLGYSEPSAFERAFRKWTKQTPSEFRSIHTLALGSLVS